MSMDQILQTLRSLDGVLELAPGPGSAFPELAWGDHFFYYAPDGRLPEREQPFATVVTKDYPDDTGSALDPPGRWRLNIHAGRGALAALASDPDRADPTDHAAADVVLPHPVYGAQGWVAVVNPGERTRSLVARLLRQAHADAVRRTERRPRIPLPDPAGGVE
ncbi:DUF6194 family protein [Pimelobacter simplex]|nr:DUF6194 family protein [Pimelobacter simplex]SFM74002.1 hypothetical protein SAMN05421671_3253 [Pimelobacter simplex]